jgi:hypothetical protein
MIAILAPHNPHSNKLLNRHRRLVLVLFMPPIGEARTCDNVAELSQKMAELYGKSFVHSMLPMNLARG